MRQSKDRELHFSIKPTPPFRLDLTAWAIRRRFENAMDRWDGTTYQRLMVIRDHPVLVSVTQAGTIEFPMLQVSAAGKVISREMRAEITQSLMRLLGYGIPLDHFYSFSKRDLPLRTLAARFRGLKPPRFASVFEALVNGICCQQLSLHVGILLLNRLAARYGLKLQDQPGWHTFPRPQELERAKVSELKALGFSRGKANYLLNASRLICRGELDLESLCECEKSVALERLLAISGVGRWTAEYVLLRGLGRLDCFPADDVGAQNNLSRWLHLKGKLDYQKVHQVLKRWEPYAGLIYFHLLLLRLEEEKLLAKAPASLTTKSGAAGIMRGPRARCLKKR